MIWILIIVFIVVVLLLFVQEIYRIIIYNNMLDLRSYNTPEENIEEYTSYLEEFYSNKQSNTSIGLYYDRINYNNFLVSNTHNITRIKKFSSRSPYDYYMDVTGVKDGTTILDCGCGVATLGDNLLARFPNIEYHCVTNSEKQAEIIRNKGNTYKLSFGSFDDVLSDYEREKFDFVFFSESIGYSKNRLELLRQVRRILKSDGKLFINTPTIIETDVPLVRKIQKKEIEMWEYNFSTIKNITRDLNKAGFNMVKYNEMSLASLHLSYDPWSMYESIKIMFTELPLYKHQSIIELIFSLFYTNGTIILAS